jgi:putative DNA primase/helicase
MIDVGAFLRTQKLKEGKIQFTDMTSAERLYREYGDDIRYNAAWKKWLVWSGKYWQTDDGALINSLGAKMVRSIYDDAVKLTDYRDRMEVEKYAIQSESTRKRKAFIEAATWITELNILTDELDKDPWLLNVQNGTLDLRTGELLPHNQKHLITKMIMADYIPEAECPVWLKFIREIMNCNVELMRFVQAAVGWAISGDISEQTMFILFGSGANGKSTFLNTLSYVLGNYSMSTQTETFMKRGNEQLSNDIARLRGARFVTTAESDLGRRLSEPIIKQITGNDLMTARFLYGEYFSFTPTFKIFMATNHKPVIKGTDHGIWRRIKLIPFTNIVPPEKQNKHLEEKLRAEASGILNWLLEGFAIWQEKGLIVPEVVSSATDEYRSEMDAIGNFLRERCIQGDGCSIRSRELFKNYQDWCDENNERAGNERFFGLRLKELKIQQKRMSDGRYWQNMTLKNSG